MHESVNPVPLTLEPVRSRAQQVCTDCRHVALVRGGFGLHCMLFGQPLMDEREGHNCLGYEAW